MKNSYLNLLYLAITVLFLGLSSCSSGSSNESKPAGSTVPDNANTLVVEGKVYNRKMTFNEITLTGEYYVKYTILNSTDTEVAYLNIALTKPPTKNMTYNIVDDSNKQTATDARISLSIAKTPVTSYKNMIAKSGTLNITIDGSQVIFKFSNLPTSILEGAFGTKEASTTIMAGYLR